MSAWQICSNKSVHATHKNRCAHTCKYAHGTCNTHLSVAGLYYSWLCIHLCTYQAAYPYKYIHVMATYDKILENLSLFYYPSYNNHTFMHYWSEVSLLALAKSTFLEQIFWSCEITIKRVIPVEGTYCVVGMNMELSQYWLYISLIFDITLTLNYVLFYLHTPHLSPLSTYPSALTTLA